jgi:hypothetical protein
VRYEWPYHHYWADLEEVQMHVTQRIGKSNHNCPNMALGGFTLKIGWLWLRNGATSAAPAKREDFH